MPETTHHLSNSHQPSTTCIMQHPKSSKFCRIIASPKMVEPKKFQLKRITGDVSRATLKKTADVAGRTVTFKRNNSIHHQKCSKFCRNTATPTIVEPKKFQPERRIGDVSRATLPLCFFFFGKIRILTTFNNLYVSYYMDPRI